MREHPKLIHRTYFLEYLQEWPDGTKQVITTSYKREVFNEEKQSYEEPESFFTLESSIFKEEGSNAKKKQ